jgi:hypothetical protein
LIEKVNSSFMFVNEMNGFIQGIKALLKMGPEVPN